MRSRKLSLLALLVAILLAGCAPEGRRERGGGPGGDIGNWGRPVRMHGDVDPVSRIYYETPPMGDAIRRSGSAGWIHP
jgi:hypothetical protein